MLSPSPAAPFFPFSLSLSLSRPPLLLSANQLASRKAKSINSGRRNKFYIRLCALLLFQVRAHGTVDITEGEGKSSCYKTLRRPLTIARRDVGGPVFLSLPRRCRASFSVSLFTPRIPSTSVSSLFSASSHPANPRSLPSVSPARLPARAPAPRACRRLVSLHPPVPLPLALFARNIKISTIPGCSSRPVQWRNYEFRKLPRTVSCFTTVSRHFGKTPSRDIHPAIPAAPRRAY